MNKNKVEIVDELVDIIMERKLKEEMSNQTRVELKEEIKSLNNALEELSETVDLLMLENGKKDTENEKLMADMLRSGVKCTSAICVLVFMSIIYLFS